MNMVATHRAVFCLKEFEVLWNTGSKNNSTVKCRSYFMAKWQQKKLWCLEPQGGQMPSQFQTKWEKESSRLIWCKLKTWRKIIKVLITIKISTFLQRSVSLGTDNFLFEGWEICFCYNRKMVSCPSIKQVGFESHLCDLLGLGALKIREIYEMREIIVLTFRVSVEIK